VGRGLSGLRPAGFRRDVSRGTFREQTSLPVMPDLFRHPLRGLALTRRLKRFLTNVAPRARWMPELVRMTVVCGGRARCAPTPRPRTPTGVQGRGLVQALDRRGSVISTMPGDVRWPGSFKTPGHRPHVFHCAVPGSMAAVLGRVASGAPRGVASQSVVRIAPVHDAGRSGGFAGGYP